jgi:hypothetical protein
MTLCQIQFVVCMRHVGRQERKIFSPDWQNGTISYGTTITKRLLCRFEALALPRGLPPCYTYRDLRRQAGIHIGRCSV